MSKTLQSGLKPRICECGCGRELTHHNKNARFYDTSCREKSRGKRRVYQRVFVGLDGEASGNDYCLLAAGRVNRTLWNRKGLSTKECLDFLLSLPKGSNSGLKPIYVWFAMDYDVNMMLKDIPFEAKKGGSIQELRKTGETRWNGYKIRYIRRKILRVSRAGRHSQSYDVWAFFGKTFERSLEDWKIEVPEIITEGKKARGSFSQWTKERLIAYNAAELKCLEDLCTSLRESIEPLELKIRSWHGPGSLAGAWLGKHHTDKKIGEKPDPLLWDAALRAYFGGRIDTRGFGIVEPVYHYDIVSAYPSAIRYLPDLSRIEWRRGKGSPPAGGIYLSRIKWEIPDRKWTPFPYRCADGSIRYPPDGEGWYWHYEIEAAIKRFPKLKIKFVEYYVAEGDITYPFHHLIEDTFRYRKELKKKGDSANVAVKLILNSLYGKFAQTVGNNRYYSPIWAGLITSHCRAQLMSVLSDDVILVMTDSVWSKAPLPVEDSSELGGWEKGDETRLVVCGAGLYKAIHADGTEGIYQRGFDKTNNLDLEGIVKRWLTGDDLYTPEFKIKRFVGMGLASITSYPWAEWVTITRRISPVAYSGTSKRYPLYPLGDDEVEQSGDFRYLEALDRDSDEISAPYKNQPLDPEALTEKLLDECSEVALGV